MAQVIRPQDISYVSTGTWGNVIVCSQDSHSFPKGKPDCRCGAATRAVCPECGREWDKEEEA